jgi:hypothetical protein
MSWLDEIHKNNPLILKHKLKKNRENAAGS